MSKPVFSVIVPCYNAEKHISDCLKSIIAQTFKNFEVIVVDDGSKDSSSKIIQDFSKKDNRIKIIKNKKNKGIGASRNDALKNAKGKYIICVEAEDYIKPNLLDTVYKTFCENKVKVVWFKYDILKPSDNSKKFRIFPLFNVQREGIFELPIDNLADFPLISWNKAYEREFLIKNGFCWTENNAYEYIEFFWKVHTRILEVYVIDEILYVHREKNETEKKTEIYKKIKDLFDVSFNVYMYINMYRLFQIYKKSYIKFVLDTFMEQRNMKETDKKIAKMSMEYMGNINFPNAYRELYF